ncbi:MAG: hypothetical protein AAFX08_02760 [Pseudomonadota bacterium]
MGIIRTAIAFLVAAATSVMASSAFYTQQIIAKQAAIGGVYTPAQQAQTYFENLRGLAFDGAPSFGAIAAIALGIGFAVAFVVKRILRPLAPIAYPIAGAAALAGVIHIINTVLFGGGTGAIGGARDAFGLTLQAVAGGLGGLVFAFLRPRG